jgi:PKD repeat protein
MYKLYAKQSFLLIGTLFLCIFSVQAQTPQYIFQNGSTTGNNAIPLGGTSWADQRGQWFWAPGDFGTVPQGKAIKTFYVRAAFADPATTWANFRMSVGQPNIMGLSTTWVTGLTQVINQASYSVGASAVDDWIAFTFDKPFPYNPNLPLVIETIQTGTNGGKRLRAGGTPINPLYTGNTQTYGASSASTGTTRRYSYSAGLDLISLAANNAGVVSTNLYNCPGTFDIKATIENAGSNQIKSVKVNWSKNGVVQTPVTYTGTLDTGGGSGFTQATIVLGSHTWSKGASLDIKIWTSSPNSTKDTVPDNDTLKATIKPAMSGTFSVGASGSDYTSLSAAITDLSTYGICGPVTLNVAAGTYTGQVIIPQINGASATNTITIKGAGKSNTLLTFGSSSTANLQTIFLSGADYVTIQDLTIENTGVTYGVGVMLTAGADYNTIKDCDIKISPTSTSSLTGGIIGTGNATSLASAGSSGNYNSFLRNNISGGYYSISFWGPGTGAYAMGNTFIDNKITDYYATGMYLYYGGETKVTGNKLTSRSGTTTSYGIYFYYQSNFEVARNEVNTAYYGFYGYYGNYVNYSSDGTRPTINNNIFNSSNLYGAVYYYMYFTDFHHNTLRSASTYTALFSSAIQSDISGNIFWNSGTGYAFYATASDFTAVDYNIYYAPTATNPLYYNTNYAKLADWQTAVPGFNTNSWQQDPMLNSTTDLHITQTSAVPFGPQRDKYTLDVDGNARCIFAPTIGADEASLGKTMQPKAAIFGPDTIFVNSPSEFLGNRTSGVPHSNRWYVNNVLVKDSLDLMVTIKSTGTYTIKVVAYSCQNKDSVTKNVVVVNPTKKPAPDFIASKNGLRIGDIVYFTDLTSGGPSGWSWDISPKTVVGKSGVVNTYNYVYGTTTTQNPGVQFTEPGLYKVCLTASNSSGSESLCKSGYIRVYHSSKLGTTTTLVTDSAGFIYDQAGPKKYYDNSVISSMLIAPCASEVYLKFSLFELECGWDYVRIYDGENNKGAILHTCTNNPATTGTTGPGFTGTTGSSCAQYCMPSLTDTFIAKSGKMYIEMASDGNTQFEGFEAFFWSKSKYVAPPTAKFTAPATGCADVRIDFVNKTIGEKVSYAWDMDGDLTTIESTSPDAFYTFSKAGKYKVTLLAYNCGGIDTFQQDITIFTPSAPKVKFSADNVLPTTLDVVKLTSNIAECVNDYFWRITPKSGSGKGNFVNGTKATSANPQVNFTDTGCYSVFLYAKNAGGKDSLEMSCYIRVKNPYCIPSVTTNVSDLGISEVSIVTLDNATVLYNKSTQGIDDYQSFVSTVSGTIESGVSYDLKVGRSTNQNTVTRTAWIDWNLDGDFADAGEKIAEDKKSSAMVWTARFTVPLTAKNGATVMRIASNQGSLNNSVCGPNKYGEYEDYRIYVTPDRTAPIITLTGKDTIYVEQGYPYTEDGATADDNLDGDISSKLKKTEQPPFNNATTGTYLIQYDVEDAAGNKAKTATRVVIVTPDITPPILEVDGKDTVHIDVADNTYTEPAATLAKDILDGDLLSKVVKTGNVNINKVGMYTLTYSVSDKAGNTATITRIVIVGDAIAPVITLKNADTVYNEVNTKYTDAGVTYTDNYCTATDMAANLTVSSNVDETEPGTYTVVYNLTDCNGNKAMPVARTVIIRDTKAPEVSLKGDSLVIINVYDTYIDDNVTASDNYGIQTIDVSGSFYDNFADGKATNLGDYTIVYTVTDKFGNKTAVMRTIRVVDKEVPVITLKDIPNVNICRWEKYTDAGYELNDNFWPDSTINVTKEGDFLTTGTQVPGVFSFRYRAEDSSGNFSYSEWRVINVREIGTSACQTGFDDNGSLEKNIQVFPNPTSGKFTIRLILPQTEQLKITVTNVLGQQVLPEISGMRGSNTLQLDLSGQSSGVYLLNIASGSQVVVKRIVVNR